MAGAGSSLTGLREVSWRGRGVPTAGQRLEGEGGLLLTTLHGLLPLPSPRHSPGVGGSGRPVRGASVLRRLPRRAAHALPGPPGLRARLIPPLIMSSCSVRPVACNWWIVYT